MDHAVKETDRYTHVGISHVDVMRVSQVCATDPHMSARSSNGRGQGRDDCATRRNG